VTEPVGLVFIPPRHSLSVYPISRHNFCRPHSITRHNVCRVGFLRNASLVRHSMMMMMMTTRGIDSIDPFSSSSRRTAASAELPISRSATDRLLTLPLRRPLVSRCLCRGLSSRPPLLGYCVCVGQFVVQSFVPPPRLGKLRPVQCEHAVGPLDRRPMLSVTQCKHDRNVLASRRAEES
jgi:hypothetical protein